MVHLIGFDLAFTVTAFGFVLFWYLPLTTPERITGCLCLMILMTYLSAGQLLALVAMAMDRYIKIVHPFAHNRICTKRYVCWIILAIHLTSVVAAVAFGVCFTWNPNDTCYYQYTSLQFVLIIYQVLVFIGLLLILAFNVKILLVSKQQQRQIQVQARPSSVTISSAINRSFNKVLGSLTLFTFIIYLPNWALFATSAAGVNIRTPMFDFVTAAVALLWNLGLLFDPLMFLLCRKDIKAFAVKLLKCSNQINVE